MGKALVEQFCRAYELDPSFVIRCQREFKRDIVPLFDEVEALRIENSELKAKLAGMGKRSQKEELPLA